MRVWWKKKSQKPTLTIKTVESSHFFVHFNFAPKTTDKCQVQDLKRKKKLLKKDLNWLTSDNSIIAKIVVCSKNSDGIIEDGFRFLEDGFGILYEYVLPEFRHCLLFTSVGRS